MVLGYAETIMLTRARMAASTTQGSIAHQFLPILCPKDQLNRELVEKLGKNSIQVRHYFSPPCHQQEMFQSFPRTNLPVTDEIEKRVLSLPLWEEMEPEHVMRVVKEPR